MPYKKVSLGGGRFKVVNRETGNVHSKATTEAKADSQLRLLHGVEHGMKPRTTKSVIGKNPGASLGGKSSHKSKHRKAKK